MNLKLLLTLITLFLIGCSSNRPQMITIDTTQKPTILKTVYKKVVIESPNVQTPSTSNHAPTKTEAILKLDTKGHTAKIRDIIVTKSGDIISASDDKTIRVWDSKTGKEKRKILGQIGAGRDRYLL